MDAPKSDGFVIDELASITPVMLINKAFYVI